jgi:hypothetical protein
MALPKSKTQKKTNVANTKDHNGRAEKKVKAQHAGNVPPAKSTVHQTHGTMGKGPKKTAQYNVKKK